MHLLKLNKAITSNKEAAFLDLHLSISNVTLSTNFMIKQLVSPALTNKVFVKPEWTQSKAQQITEQLQSNPFFAVCCDQCKDNGCVLPKSTNLPHGRIFVPLRQIYSQIVLTFLAFYHNFSVNVQTMFETNENVQKKNISYN